MARRSPNKKPSRIPPPEGDALLHRLEDALSEAELRRVLACALLVLNDTARKQLLARLEPETAAALAPVLNPPAKSARGTRPAAPAAGKGKLRQEWDRLWEQWAAVVEATCDEKGKYVQQEAHWEPPYLDTSAITDDLDALASKMRPLIPRVIAEHIAPEFSFALDELDDELYAGLPDWIEPGGGEPCVLGPEATSCVLEWQWTVALRDGRDAPAFLDDVRDLENRLENVELSDQAIKKFVLGLSDEHLRGALASITRQRASARWSEAFTRAYGCWAEILRDLSKRWNPALHVETSRANIAQDWTLALPLVQNAVKRKAFAEAATLIDEALRSRLRLDKTARWEPCEQLLVHREHTYYGNDQNAKLTNSAPPLAADRPGAGRGGPRRGARAPDHRAPRARDWRRDARGLPRRPAGVPDGARGALRRLAQVDRGADAPDRARRPASGVR